MNTDWYFLDTNALNGLTAVDGSSLLDKEQCRIPSEVLHEAQGLPDIKALKGLEYRTNAELLGDLGEVMSTVEPTDFKLVDLYRNRGNADPILVAAALHAIRKSEPTLFPDRWLIVTDDAALQNKATDFEIPTLSLSQFKTLLASGQA